MIEATNHPHTHTPRLTKSRVLALLAVAAVLLAATFLHADSGGTQPEHNTLAGTWKSEEFGGSNLASFMSDGRMIYTIALTIFPGSPEFAAPAPGEWARTGNREFVSTAYAPLSTPTAGFTHLVKLNDRFTLNDASDELTKTGTITIYSPDGTVQASFPTEETHFRRIIAGQ